jgi:hypothetical protein
MPRKLPRAVLVFRGSAPFVTLLTAFVALAVLAQVTSASQASGKSDGVSAMARAGTPAQEPQHTLPPLLGSAARAVAAPSHAKNSGVVATGLGNFLFRPAVTYGTGGGYAYSVTAADVNSDGKADLIVTDFYSQTLGVLLGNGDGTFQTPVFYDSRGRGGGPLGVADVNGGGRTDILFVNWTDSNGNMPSLLAVLESKHGTIPDGGLVTFYDGTTALGSGALVSGTAAFTTSSLSAKTHTIKATYAGNAIFKPSTGTVRQIVNKYATTMALSSSLNPPPTDRR